MWRPVALVPSLMALGTVADVGDGESDRAAADPGSDRSDVDLLVCALGSLRVARGGRNVDIPKSKARAVLALLLMHRGSIVPAEVVIDQVWGPRPPNSARHGLHVVISSLRAVFGCEPRTNACNLMSSPAGYHLALETDQFDVAIAEGLVRLARSEAERGHASGAEATFLAAESWFRDPPYAEFSYEEFAQAEIRRLTEIHWSAREDRLGIQLERGAHVEIIPELEALVIEHPTRERLLRQLMTAMCRSGRTGDALQAYEYARLILDREYGCPPSRETVLLADGIRGSGAAA